MPAKLAKLLDPGIRSKNIDALSRRFKGAWWSIARPAVPDPIFIVGCSRSGTTVTFETIASSPDLLSFGYELPQFWNGLYGPHHNHWRWEGANADDARPEHRKQCLSWFYQNLGRGWVVDKTCINVMRIEYLQTLFPNAYFIYIQRDGRDNISSMMDGWRQNGHFGLTQFLGDSPDPVAIEDGEFSEWNFFLPPDWRAYNQSSLAEACAHQWISANRAALNARAAVQDDRWIHLHYEDLFHRPVDMFRSVFNRLGIPFGEELQQRCATLTSRPTSIVKGAPAQQKWRKHNPDAIRSIVTMIEPMMHELGYSVDD